MGGEEVDWLGGRVVVGEVAGESGEDGGAEGVGVVGEGFEGCFLVL